MAERAQSFQKHARFLPLFHFFVLPVLLINVVNTIRYAIVDTRLHDLFQVVLAIALTVQDRVIRLEMRLRLRGILPPDLQPNINELSHRQLVALRFASDAEMTELVRDVLAGKLATTKDIKGRIKGWQSDWLRA